MEDTLRAGFYIEKVQITCLNPCFNGRYSQRVSLLSFVMMRMVLILVLMEDTLREVDIFTIAGSTNSLNPCFNGRYSQRAKTYVSLYTSIWGMFKLLETLLLT